jgi:hypothetical protein
MVGHDRDKKENANTPGPEDPASASVTRKVGGEGGTPDVSSWPAFNAAFPRVRRSAPPSRDPRLSIF